MTGKRVLALFLAASIAFSTRAFAEDYTSGSFIASNPNINVISGTATSTNFETILTAGQTVNGEATSTNFTLQMGFLYFDAPAFKSQNWRWYDDENNETPITVLADENVSPSSIDSDAVIKLRISVAEDSGIESLGTKFRLQYSTASDFSEGVADVEEIGDCVEGSMWCYADGGGSDNAVISAKVLSDADACSGGVGDGCGTHNESGTSVSAYTHAGNAVAEYEFTVEESGATPNTTFFFRLVDVNTGIAVPLQSGASYPSLATGGTSLTFSIGGLPTGTTTASETTDIDTTSGAVPFGTLPIGADQVAAHRLVVTTNAQSGYGVYVLQVQGLLGNTGGEISGVSGTNAAPASWGSGCGVSAAGCFGYHTTDAVLGSGNTTRFAADDSYASFESAAREIAYDAGPVSSSTIDMVYRVEARGTQDAGDYSTNIAYIVVPTF